MRGLLTRAGGFLIRLAMVGAGAWGGLALWFDGPGYSVPLAAVFAAGSVMLAMFVRPLGRAVVIFVPALAALLVWWLSIPPSNDRDWQPDVSRLASATIDGNLITLYNVRDFEYRDDGTYEERWKTSTYDLDGEIGEIKPRSGFAGMYWLEANTVLSTVKT